MRHFFQLYLRILILSKDGRFTVEPLEITGQVRGSDREEALQCLALCIEGSLAVGEPFWREAPQALTDIWDGRKSQLPDGTMVQRMLLKIRGQKEVQPSSASSSESSILNIG